MAKIMYGNYNDLPWMPNHRKDVDGKVTCYMGTDLELISEGRRLADELGTELCGVLLGDNVDNLAKEMGGYGADKVYVCNHPLLHNYTTDAYTKVICDLVHSLKPEVLLFGATTIGRDLAPRCAARLHTGLCADCTHLDVDMARRALFSQPKPRGVTVTFSVAPGTSSV